jgi:hypothetical protein
LKNTLNSILDLFWEGFHGPATLFLSHDILKTIICKKLQKLMKKDRKRVALIKTDYEEGRLQPIPGGHPQLVTPLFLFVNDILKKKINKNIIEIDEKRV